MSGGRFAGRVALVTGAGSSNGIGFAAARCLAEGGAAVAIASTTDRIHERVARASLGRASRRAATSAISWSEGVAERLVAATLAAHGDQLDILVNNAGMVALGSAEESSTVVALDAAEWERGIDRNLGTAFRVTRAALPSLIASGHGRVVFVSSVTGPLVSNPGSAVYGAAKAGLLGLDAGAGDRGRPRRGHGQRGAARLDRERVAAGRGGDRRPEHPARPVRLDRPRWPR